MVFKLHKGYDSILYAQVSNGRLHFTNIVAWLPSPLQHPRKQLLLGKTAHS